MLNKIKEKNEKIIKQQLESSINGVEATVEWGFPFSSVKLNMFEENKNLETEVTISFNMMEENVYSLKSFSYIKDGEEKILGEPVIIDSGTIKFIIETVTAISSHLFVTREQPQQEPKPTEETVEAQKESEVVEKE